MFCPPKVAVIIPIYNSSETAILAVNSVLNQTYKELVSIILIDDGSTDSSFDILSEKYKKIQNIDIYKIKNSGAAEARNFGVSKTDATFVAFLDSDDEWNKDKLLLQLPIIIEDKNCGMVGALTNMKNFFITPSSCKKKLTEISFREMLVKNRFQTSTVIIRRQVFEDLGGFPKNRRFAEEGDLFLKIAYKYRTVLINQILVNYSGGKSGFGESGLSSNLRAMQIGEIKNYTNAYKRNHIGFPLYFILLIYSNLKYLRRLLKVCTRLSIFERKRGDSR